MKLMALASLLIAIGVGGVAFAHSLATLVILVVVMSIGEIFFSPIASSIVSEMAPEAIRGRYMGAWTVMWNGGASAGPLLGGILIGSIGGREAFGTVLVLGLVGAVLFMLLSTGRPLADDHGGGGARGARRRAADVRWPQAADFIPRWSYTTKGTTGPRLPSRRCGMVPAVVGTPAARRHFPSNRMKGDAS